MKACSQTSMTSSGLKPAGPILVHRDPVVRKLLRDWVLKEDHPPHPAHRGDGLEGDLPLIDGPERLGQGVGALRILRWHYVRRRAKAREVVLVQDHPVVLETEPPRQLGEFGVTRIPSASEPKLGKLFVEPVHLSYVAGIQREVLGDLPVRDPRQS